MLCQSCYRWNLAEDDTYCAWCGAHASLIDSLGVGLLGLGMLALLDAARALARDLNVDEILLDTWEANHDAHAFFRSAGFSPRRMLFRATP